MTTHRTIARKGKKGGFRVRLFLILATIVTVVGLVGWIWYDQDSSSDGVASKPRDVVQTVTINPTPTNRPIKLAAEIPQQLTDEQRFGLWVVEQVLDDSEKWVGEPTIEMSENDREVFIALILTESSFRQFDEDGSTLDSGIDCDGLAQLCNDPAVCSPEERWNPFEKKGGVTLYIPVFCNVNVYLAGLHAQTAHASDGRIFEYA